ncbi:MAG: amidase [Betaproteobacteria bacterium]|nr:amidase [Betaproteobacteria bacterium]
MTTGLQPEVSTLPRDLHFLGIAEAAKLIESRKLSPVELTRALLDRIQAIDPQINAFITVTADLALKQAKEAEAEILHGRYRGPLHGIPVGLKDIYNTAGILTSGQSRICIDNIPQTNATATEKLYRAGALLMGKLATHEFAHGGPSFDLPWPPARNPWNTAHYTGGSSSGSAGAVAGGMVLGALGTDTGGSIRTPAFYCGVVGLKPTYGLVSRTGVIPSSSSFDHCGPLAWTVEDCAILVQAIAGYDPQDSGSVDVPIPDYRAALNPDIRGLRIGVIRHFWEDDWQAGAEVRQAMDSALDILCRLGATLEDVRMRPLQDYYDVKLIIAETEAFCIHQKTLMERAGDFGADFLGRAAVACLFQAGDYLQAQRERRRMVVEMLPLYEKYDVLVTAGAGPAPRLDSHRTVAVWERPKTTTPFSVTGGPALALCNGFTGSGLPLGMQLAGKPFDEATVLRVGHAYEQATPWRNKRPIPSKRVFQSPITPTTDAPGAAEIDLPTRQLVERLVRRAGLELTELQIARLCEAAPHALAMARRIHRDYLRSDEPANVFRF